jgi:DNA-binding MarR family transcriptional regulator
VEVQDIITDAEYRALAALRYRIRRFIQEGDAAARRCNLEPQQYLMLLAIRGLPQGSTATIRALAERLALRHHSAVELVDRLESRGLVRRGRSTDDRREVRVSLTPRGLRLLEQVAQRRIGELRATGAALADAINALVERKGSPRKRRATKRLRNPESTPRTLNGTGSRRRKAKIMPSGRMPSV